MIHRTIRTFLGTAALSLALATPEAHANLVLMGSVNGAHAVELASVGDNSVVNYTGSLGDFQISNLVAVGQPEFGGSGELFDLSSLDVSAKGTGSLTLSFLETGLMGVSGAPVSVIFSGNISRATVWRGIYATDGLGGQAWLGTTTGTNSIYGAVLPVGYSALGEMITIKATGPGAILSSDDAVMANVAEPAVLSLLGIGLTALGLARRRKSG